jgi:predicted GIY-YIG superfamily endonuclease
MKRFDRKFGADLLRELPAEPAVYLFRDEGGEVLYAGKAKNIRRRLASYRNATRRKAHRKMRTLVREASSLEVRLQPSERAALLAENELIRTLRPAYNVDGAYDFLYPSIGVGARGHQALFCFTTKPDVWRLDLHWYGAFRPRWRARDAFEALTRLLGRVGHAEPRSRLPRSPRLRGSRLVAFRRLPPALVDSLHAFLAARARIALEELAVALLERSSARQEAAEVQDDLRRLAAFYTSDLVTLRDALRVAHRAGTFVPQGERDALFIESRRR